MGHTHNVQHLFALFDFKYIVDDINKSLNQILYVLNNNCIDIDHYGQFRQKKVQKKFFLNVLVNKIISNQNRYLISINFTRKNII